MERKLVFNFPSAARLIERWCKRAERKLVFNFPSAARLIKRWCNRAERKPVFNFPSAASSCAKIVISDNKMYHKSYQCLRFFIFFTFLSAINPNRIRTPVVRLRLIAGSSPFFLTAAVILPSASFQTQPYTSPISTDTIRQTAARNKNGTMMTCSR